MPDKKPIPENVLIRISKVDVVISDWLRENGLFETEPEKCVKILADSGIYRFEPETCAHYFREDLRVLRNIRRMDILSDLVIEQNGPMAHWHIKLKPCMNLLKGEKPGDILLNDCELPESVILRISKMDTFVGGWMRKNGIAETTPEECIGILVRREIYQPGSRGGGGARNLRKDLRTLREYDRFDMFTDLMIEQNAPRGKWHIRLSSK
jgi:hypothetical protein